MGLIFQAPLSACSSQYSLVHYFSSLRSFGWKAGWIFTYSFLLCTSSTGYASRAKWGKDREREKEMQLVGVDSILSELQCECMERKVSLLKNFGSCGFSLLSTTTTPSTTSTWLLEGQAGEKGEKTEKQRGKWFSHSLLSIRSSVSHSQNQDEQSSCPRALSVTWCPLPSVQSIQSRLQVLREAEGREGREGCSTHHQLSSTAHFDLLQCTCLCLRFRVPKNLLGVVCSVFVDKQEKEDTVSLFHPFQNQNPFLQFLRIKVT